MGKWVHRVQYYETDKMGITHHANYIHWMEEARVAMLEELGWGYKRMEELGLSSPVIGVECTYKATTTFWDEVEVETSIREYRGVHLVVGYTMRRVEDGRVVLEGTSRHCFMDREGKFARLRRDYPELDQLFTRLAAQQGASAGSEE